ncbi:MAG: SPFH domain-containing protein [Candidatus Micrarchaeota archaeon]|nr:SPFH domain-containing protein [Candidatus Micrarchaeota archaeon]
MNRQVVVFTGIIAAILLIAYFGLFTLKNPVLLAILVLAVAAGAALFPKYIELKEYERAVVFRFGRFSRVAGPGILFIFPSIESHQLVDLRTQTIDTAPQNVITKDNIKVKIDSIVYLKIVDPKKVVVEVKDYKTAVVQLLLSRIREIASRMSLDELLAKTEEIDAQLHAVIRDAADEWGINALRVEVQSIELPQSLVEAMQKRKEAQELRARVETEAEARSTSIEILDRAASKMSDTTLSYLYLDALKKISEGRSNKIIFPLELSHLASLLSGRLVAPPAGGKQKAEPSFEETAKALLDAYVEKKKELIEKTGAAGEHPVKEAAETLQGKRKTIV